MILRTLFRSFHFPVVRRSLDIWGATRVRPRGWRGGSLAGAVGAMPIGFALAAGFTAILVGTAAAAALDRHDTVLRAGVVAACVAVVTALTAGLPAAICTAGMGWLFTDGFLVNDRGDLGWHGVADLVRLAAFVAAALVGLAVGRSWQHRRAAADAVREERPLRGHDVDMTVARPPMWLPPWQRNRSPRVSIDRVPNGTERRRNG